MQCSKQAMPSLQSPVGHRIYGHRLSIESVYFKDQISAELMEIYFVNAKYNGFSILVLVIHKCCVLRLFTAVNYMA